MVKPIFLIIKRVYREWPTTFSACLIMPSIRLVIREHERFKRKSVRAFFSSNVEGKPMIIVNPKWVRKASYLKMENTIKHELIHAWLSWKGTHENINDGHGELFMRKGMEIGLDVKHTVSKYPKLKPIYKRLKKEKELSGSTIL